MKKMFLAAITALALCSYSYAQDDYEDEYGEDAPAREEAAPAVEEAEEDEAPAPAPAAKPAKNAKKSDGSAFLGIGMGLTSNFADKGLKEIDVKIKLNESMMVTAILGLYHYGETSTENKTPAGTITTDAGDNHTGLAIGAGFDYFLPMPLLPASAGIDLIYVSNGEIESTDPATKTTVTASSGDFLIDLMFGVHAELVPNMILTGKVGLGFDYFFASNETSIAGASTEANASRLDFGLKAGVYATWFFM